LKPESMCLNYDSLRLESAAVTLDPDSITLRPVTPEDYTFLLELYKSSRGDDLRGLEWEEARISEFLSMQHEAQQRFHQNDHQDATNEVIMHTGVRTGQLMTERREDELRCIDLAIVPEYRNRGIGSLIIRQLQDEARADGKPLRLQVIRFNRAVNLFERLGFERTSETGTHFQMEWLP